jgi:hypothetical protein
MISEKEKAKQLREKEKAKKLREKEKAKKLREKEKAKQPTEKLKKTLKSRKVSGGEQNIIKFLENVKKINEILNEIEFSSINNYIENLNTYINNKENNGLIAFIKNANIVRKMGILNYLPKIEISTKVEISIELLKDMLKMSHIYKIYCKDEKFFTNIKDIFRENDIKLEYPNYAINYEIHKMSFNAVRYFLNENGTINIKILEENPNPNNPTIENNFNTTCLNFIYVCMERDRILQKIANPIAGRGSVSFKYFADKFKLPKATQIYPEGVGEGEGEGVKV